MNPRAYAAAFRRSLAGFFEMHKVFLQKSVVTAAKNIPHIHRGIFIRAVAYKIGKGAKKLYGWF
ncbi:MAG: hypothetical protein II881_09000 [Oscillospiraceae bacterium]|nr:hypothetical protein [Oscillospiraceae bacterium]